MTTVRRVREIAEPYFRGHDLQPLASDVVSLDVREHLCYPLAHLLGQLRG